MADPRSCESLVCAILLEWRGHLTQKSHRIQCRKTTERTVRERARKVLEYTKKCAQGAPEILDGDGLERTLESEADKLLLRKIATQTIVLLKNENGLLPLKPKVDIFSC